MLQSYYTERVMAEVTNVTLLPGKVPGYKNTDVKLLPSSTTKKSIQELYLHAAAASLMRAVGYLHDVHESMATTPPKHRGDATDEYL